MAETRALDNATRLKGMINTPSTLTKFANVVTGGTASEKQARAGQFLAGLLSQVNNSKLKECDPVSVLSAAFVAAQCDLSIIPTLGQAAIVPYKNKGVMLAQFQVMTNGLVNLARNSDQIADLRAIEIYADEFVSFDRLKGVLVLGEHDDDCTEVVGYAAYVKFTNGGEHTEYWSKKKCMDHGRKYSKSFEFGPWHDNFDAMAKKTVLKYLINHYCPKSTIMAKAMAADQAIVNGIDNGDISYDYADNATASDNIATVFSEEESNERAELISKLGTVGITEDLLVPSVKGAKSIDDVPTQHLRELVKQECN